MFAYLYALGLTLFTVLRHEGLTVLVDAVIGALLGWALYTCVDREKKAELMQEWAIQTANGAMEISEDRKTVEILALRRLILVMPPWAFEETAELCMSAIERKAKWKGMT
jgi:hypothetical protein